MISRQRRACAPGSPRPTVLPSAPSGAVPATVTNDPARTAREIPIFGSQGLPLETSFRMSEFLDQFHDFPDEVDVLVLYRHRLKLGIERNDVDVIPLELDLLQR